MCPTLGSREGTQVQQVASKGNQDGDSISGGTRPGRALGDFRSVALRTTWQSPAPPPREAPEGSGQQLWSSSWVPAGGAGQRLGGGFCFSESGFLLGAITPPRAWPCLPSLIFVIPSLKIRIIIRKRFMQFYAHTAESTLRPQRLHL